MEAIPEKESSSPEKNKSSAEIDTFSAFENNLREENLRILRSLRIQEMTGKIKPGDPKQWPFK